MDGMFDPFLRQAAAGGSTSNNVDVKVNQNITSNDPVAAGKESARYTTQTVTRALLSGFGN